MSFFFQAEDGIRYHCVTGVQTCALPISLIYAIGAGITAAAGTRLALQWILVKGFKVDRSEERRVGKECRCRRSPYHQKEEKREGRRQSETALERANRRLVEPTGSDQQRR